MLSWIARGLHQRRITTGYPRRPEPPPEGFQGQIQLLHTKHAGNKLAQVCPTEAITVDPAGTLTLDRGRCILCGACVRAAPDRFAFAERYESAARTREGLIEDGSGRDHDTARLRRTLGEETRTLRRSIHVRHIDTGSDGAEEWEIQALWNPYYDIQRLGFFLTAAPRHADILIVTGGVTEPMRAPLERTWQVMPEPKALIAAGTDACSGGLSASTGLTAGGVGSVLPVDVYVPGSPPAPIALLDGLLLAVGLLRAGSAT
jgi:Ni,Fe-hydrogenase III small subunit/formate hydrogenlyase subunit 6/NADH:ubiquinone oxidoreductase subunit I